MTALSKQFEVYLKQELNVSGKTLRNYRADLLHFTKWARVYLTEQGTEVLDLENVLPHFSGFLVATYRSFHVENGTPQSTTNRRLSTLRNFGKFLANTGHTKHNPALLITNLKEELSHEQKLNGIVSEFAKHLEKDGASPSTLKNYLSDVRHFSAWLIKQEDWVSKPVRQAQGKQETQSD